MHYIHQLIQCNQFHSNLLLYLRIVQVIVQTNDVFMDEGESQRCKVGEQGFEVEELGFSLVE